MYIYLCSALLRNLTIENISIIHDSLVSIVKHIILICILLTGLN